MKLKSISNNKIFLKCKAQGKETTNGRLQGQLCDGHGGLNGVCCDPYYCKPGPKLFPSVAPTWRCDGRCRKDDCT